MLKLKLFSICLLIAFNAQAREDALEEVTLITPIPPWGTMVYVKSKDRALKNKLLKEMKGFIEHPFGVCSTEYDKYENWYCEQEPTLVFRGLDGYGEKRSEAMLCRESNRLPNFKYFSKEVFDTNYCLRAYWWEDVDSYEFSTYNNSFED